MTSPFLFLAAKNCPNFVDSCCDGLAFKMALVLNRTMKSMTIHALKQVNAWHRTKINTNKNRIGMLEVGLSGGRYSPNIEEESHFQSVARHVTGCAKLS